LTRDETPSLRFRLLGTWRPVLLGELDSSELISDFVASLVGKRDVDATVRARMRHDLIDAVTRARNGHAAAMFIATEIATGIPMPVTLTVYSPPEMRMSPAIGTTPAAVMTALRTSFARSDMAHLETAHAVSIPGSEILRLHHVDDRDVPEQPDLHARTLTADYWYTVPGSKRLTIATFSTFSTPMGDIPNVMLAYFDAVIAASYWEDGPDVTERGAQ
jgi:hypothetical protein